MAINDYEFTIPLDNMAVYVNQSGTFYCQTQIALLAKSDNSIILGGAFFTSFLGIFDVENDRMGLADNARGLPGSSIVCKGPSCKPYSSIRQPGTGNIPNAIIYVIIASILIGVLIFLTISCCRMKKKRAAKKKEAELLVHQGSERRRGYGLNDEREEEYEDNLEAISLDETEKPTL